MAQEDVVVRRYVHNDHILVAELCRPRVKNAFNDAVYQQLIDALREYEENEQLHALVITGHGDYFTSGADIAHGLSVDENGDPLLPSQGWPKRFMEAMIKCPKLLVAAVNGSAIGIGVTLLLHCDFVYAVEHATFWTPFMRIGIVPEFAASYTFPATLGPLLSNQMLMQSKKIDAARAYAGGIVGTLLPAKDFMLSVFADLESMVARPLVAKNLPTYKRMTRRLREPEVREAIHHEYVELDRRFLSGETQEAAMELLMQLKPKASKL